MRTHRSVSTFIVRACATSAGALALSVALNAPAAAQHTHADVQMPTTGLRAEWIRDIDQLEKKYMALFDAMKDKYGWRPGEGVRSAGEVFGHVAGANMMLPSMVGIQAPEGMAVANMQEAMQKMQALEKSEPTKIRETLAMSFTHAKHAIAMTPDDQLDGMVKLFGQDATKRAALMLLVNHMHEHLGQSIAYARANGVKPPWSAGGI
jgi:uncharacterized damage-inducible protein DinB